MKKLSHGSQSARVEALGFSGLRRSIVLVLVGFVGGAIADRNCFQSQGKMESEVSELEEGMMPIEKSVHEVVRGLGSTNSDVGQLATPQAKVSAGLLRGDVFDQAPESFIDPSRCYNLNYMVQNKEKAVEEMRILTEKKKFLEGLRMITKANRREINRIDSIVPIVKRHYAEVDWDGLRDVVSGNSNTTFDRYQKLISQALVTILDTKELEDLDYLTEEIGNSVAGNPKKMAHLAESVESLREMVKELKMYQDI